jgi:hypothetical protein
MKVSELRDTYYDATDKVSELVRHLSFAGIAVIWILKTGEHSGGLNYSHKLLWILILFVASLSCDVLQYVYKSIVWGSLNRHYWNIHHDNEADVRPSRKWNWVSIVLFWSKTVLVIVAYAFLMTFIYLQLRS